MECNPAEVIRGRYIGDHGRLYQEQQNMLPASLYGWMARLRAKRLGHIIPTDARVFEYGVGLGYNLAQLPARRKAGFDICEPSEIFQQNGIEFFQDIEMVPNHCWDVVLCHHVLEHVPSPLDTLKEIKQKVVSGGMVLVFVPYEREVRYRCYRPTEQNGHIFSWNPQTLGALLVNAGFKIKTITLSPFGYDRRAALIANRFRLGEVGYHTVHKVLHIVRPSREVRAILTI